MATALKQADFNETTANMRFTDPKGPLPVALVYPEGEGQDKRTGTFLDLDVPVINGRGAADQYTLDKDGFAFREFDTAVTDFYDRAHVENVYYPEMEALIKEMTGCSKVMIFDHTCRIDDESAQDELKLRPPAKVVHNDFTEVSAEQRVRDLLPPDEAEARLAKRFGSINVWRPIKGPVETAPLAICDYSSLAYEDLVLSERHYPDGRIGRIYHIAHNPNQRWTYFPQMETDEIIVLKCYDSLEDGTARWTGHGSFQDPHTPPGAPPRESIEIRSMYFFD